ncbi:hypothetical protein AAFF_G00284550 [Aldrovandia affinis]|uniref:Uncharacterized protein n=1 Tax=Aldrovandia affinis TaxID=143900 RepID=A0AAD7TBF4_9TELE|nr:hypothetical protein AAFF_G00284550 [Aldrovandia affinis]
MRRSLIIAAVINQSCAAAARPEPSEPRSAGRPTNLRRISHLNNLASQSADARSHAREREGVCASLSVSFCEHSQSAPSTLGERLYTTPPVKRRERDTICGCIGGVSRTDSETMTTGTAVQIDGSRWFVMTNPPCVHSSGWHYNNVSCGTLVPRAARQAVGR